MKYKTIRYYINLDKNNWILQPKRESCHKLGNKNRNSTSRTTIQLIQCIDKLFVQSLGQHGPMRSEGGLQV